MLISLDKRECKMPKKAYFSIMVHFHIIYKIHPAVKRLTAGFLIFLLCTEIFCHVAQCG